MRVAGTEKAPVLSGYAVRYNVPSEDMGGWREVIKPGACSACIGRDDIRALWNHDDGLVLGRTSAGTLALTEDSTGVHFRIDLPDASWVRDRLISIKRRDVTGCSFGFFVERDEWSIVGNQKVRNILKFKEIVEISPGVTFPAYPQTDVALASMRSWFGRPSRPWGDDDIRFLRQWLRLMRMQLDRGDDRDCEALRDEATLRRGRR